MVVTVRVVWDYISREIGPRGEVYHIWRNGPRYQTSCSRNIPPTGYGGWDSLADLKSTLGIK
jgi:hypothetical protein